MPAMKYSAFYFNVAITYSELIKKIIKQRINNNERTNHTQYWQKPAGLGNGRGLKANSNGGNSIQAELNQLFQATGHKINDGHRRKTTPLTTGIYLNGISRANVRPNIGQHIIGRFILGVIYRHAVRPGLLRI